MKSYLISFILLWVLPGALFVAQAQEVNEFHFQHYSIRDGLASSFTYCTYEDQQGFLWIGTSNGLYLHDGKRIIPYQPVGDSSSILKSHPIKCFLEDSQGNLWIGTQGEGVFILDKNRTVTRHIKHSPDSPDLTHNEILCLAEDVHSRIWVGTESGVNIISADGKSIVQISPEPEKEGALGAGAVLTICPDNNGNIWLGTWAGGTFVASIQSETTDLNRLVFSRIEHNPSDPTSIAGNNVWQISQDSLGRMWFGVYGAGISLLPSSDDSEFINIGANPGSADGILNEDVFTTLLDQDAHLWVSTSKGLSISQAVPQSINPVELKRALSSGWIHLQKSLDPEFGPISNKIQQISQGRSGNIWLSTEAGISSYHSEDNLFVNHSVKRDLIWSSRILALCESYDGSILLGIANSVYRYQSQVGELNVISNHPDQVTALYEDYQHRLWVGAKDGLYLNNKGVISKINLSCSKSVTNILLGPENQLWVTTFGSLYHIDLASEEPEASIQIVSELPTMGIYDMVWETKNQAWLATVNHGLVRLTYTRDQVEHTIFRPNPTDPHSLVNQNFMSLCLDGDDIWIGTLQGLQRYHVAGNTFSAKSLEEGLQSPSIYQVVQDPIGKIWALSPPGIARWDEEAQQFTYFDHRHGLASQNFNQHSIIQSRSGKWIIAGEKGLSFFDPKRICPTSSLPIVKVTGINLFNKALRVEEIPEFGDRAVLIVPIHETREMSLNYQQNNLTLTFSDMSFRQTGVSLFRYRLHGLENEWQTTANKGEVSYANLAPSIYTFQVQARDHFGKWGPVTELIITITPPFWQTAWFRILIALLTIGFITGAFLWRIRKARRIENALSKMVSLRTRELKLAHEREFEARVLAEEANKVKSSFLSTMSHEIRTPLNAVIGTAHLLLEDNPRPEQEDSLQLLNFSAKNLLTLINDVLDYSKMEAGKLELEEIPFNLKTLVRDVVRTLEVKAVESGIGIDWEYPADLPCWYRGDQTRLSQVLINLIGNAIKFTPEGKVAVKVSAHDQGVKIEVIDTGIGIPLDRQKAVFEEFSQSSSSTTRNFGGTGLGLAITGKLLHMMGSEIFLESEESVGSNFYFYLNLPYASLEELPQNKTLPPTTQDVEFEGLNVLIAEDNLVNQKVITKFMKKWGIHHEIVSNGAQAVEAVLSKSFDLVLMDMNMPIMDGIEATSTIRMNGVRVPILGLSAATLPEEVRQMKEAGMLDVIPKPFDPTILREKISRALLINKVR